jgi:hypothetical protein
VDGASIWASDGVHLTSNATRVAAMKMMAYVIGGETAEPANKRARLESVIPVRPPPRRPNLCSLCRRRPPGLYRPRSGCPASCQSTNAATRTHKDSSAGGEASNIREEVNLDQPERSLLQEEGPEVGPEAAALAAGAAGIVRQERVEL